MLRQFVTKITLTALLTCLTLSLQAQPQQYQMTKLSINNTEVDNIDVIKLNVEISSLDYDKYNALLFPVESDQSSTILSPEVTQAMVDRYHRKNRRVVCFYLSDVKNTLLCLFDDKETMMAITGNTMLYAWVGQNIKEPFFDGAPEDYRYAGADLRGKDVKKRDKQINKLGDTPRVENIEKVFFRNILEPEIKKHNKNFAFITATLDTNKWFSEYVIVHEALHAKYFLDKTFKKTIDNYIKKGFKNNGDYIELFFPCIQRTLFDSGLYPGIYDNIELRNTEIANILLEINNYYCSSYKINPSAVGLYDQITKEGLKMPDLWYKLFKKTEVSPGKYILYYNMENYTGPTPDISSFY